MAGVLWRCLIGLTLAAAEVRYLTKVIYLSADKSDVQEPVISLLVSSSSDTHK